MKTVKVELTIDQWMFDGLVDAVGDLAEVAHDQSDNDALAVGMGAGLLPETRTTIEYGYLWDIHQHLLDIQEQSRNQ